MTEDEMDFATKHLTTKSSKIRTLARLGATRSQIAKYLGIRYQHVRNVLVQPAPVDENRSPEPPRLEAASGGGDGPRPLTIEEAKQGLAAHFGVPANAIEITIRG